MQENKQEPKTLINFNFNHEINRETKKEKQTLTYTKEDSFRTSVNVRKFNLKEHYKNKENRISD